MRITALIVTVFVLQTGYGQERSMNYLKAMAFSSESEYDSALFYINRYISEKPGNDEAIYQRACILFESGRLQDAIQDFKQLDGKYSNTASLMLARSEARLGHTKESIGYLSSYLRTSTKVPESELLLDKDLLLLEGSQEWNDLWREKDWYNPLDKQISEAMYLVSTENYLDAVNVLNILEKKGYKKSLVNQLLGDIYLRTENFKEARTCLDIAVKSDPRNLQALKLRIDLLIRTDELELADEDCERLFRQAPAEFDLYLQYGELKNKLNAYEDAQEIIQTYISLFPGDPEAYFTLGKVHLENNKYLNAIGAFNKALERDNGNWKYFYSRGVCYSNTRTYKYAIRDFSMALDLNPSNGDIWFDKGLAELSYGDQENACYSLKKAYDYGVFKAGEYIERNCGK